MIYFENFSGPGFESLLLHQKKYTKRLDIVKNFSYICIIINRGEDVGFPTGLISQVYDSSILSPATKKFLKKDLDIWKKFRIFVKPLRMIVEANI